MFHTFVIMAAVAADPLSKLLAILFRVARDILLVVGGGGGLFMIVKGKIEENPRDTQEGILALVGAGVLVAATFAVQAIFK